MNAGPLVEIALFCAALTAAGPPVGRYLLRVFEGPLPGGAAGAWLERCGLRAIGVSEPRGQDWKEYTGAVLLLSCLGTLAEYLLHRAQGILPLNPEHLRAVAPDLAFNTAVSFASNTSWQSYAGETTLSYLSQMAGVGWQTLVSVAMSMGIAMAFVRGLTHKPEGSDAGLGNFWKDLVRGLLFILLPLCAMGTLVQIGAGSIQNLDAYRTVTTLEGARQRIAMGPVASQMPLKLIGACGGGFFNANSAHPFENPTPLTNFVQVFWILILPAGFLHAFGRMTGDSRQGWVLFCALGGMFLAGTLLLLAAEQRPGSALQGLGLDLTAGNLEGKEVRFGLGGSALYAAATTGSSCGAVNAMHGSFTALGGLVLMMNLQVGEVVFGGAGAGLYALLMQVLIAAFIAGLVVGRTPEYLGKKVEMQEMRLVVLYALTYPMIVLTLTALATMIPAARASLAHVGPHGLSEALYAYSSAAATNGSAFASLDANTLWWNLTLGLAMLGGRFLPIVPLMALAGSMARRRPVPAGAGTLPTNSRTFGLLLVGVIVVESALVFFPALMLGPLLEHASGTRGVCF